MASRSLGTLTIDLIAKVGGFVAGMDKAARESEKFKKKVAANVKAASMAVAAAGTALIGLGALYAKNTAEFESAQAQLRTALESTGGAAGLTEKQLRTMADELSRASTFDATSITKAQTALLTYSGIVGDQFTRAQQAVIDMSARTGQSLVQSAEQIGRALDTPSKGMSSLVKQGFRFTESQQEVIKHLEATGRTAEAQGIILDALEESYKGSAQAARGTFGGALWALKDALTGLMTGDENTLTGAKDAVNDLTATLQDPNIKRAIDDIVGALASITTTVIEAISWIVKIPRAIGEAAARVTGGIAIGDTAHLEQAITRLEGMRLASGRITEAQERELDSLKEKLRVTRELEQMAKSGVTTAAPPGVASVDEDQILAEARAAKAAAKATSRKPERDKEAEAALRAAQAIEDEIVSLERLTKTWGMTADELKLYDLAQMGASKTQQEYARSLLESVTHMEAYKERVDAAKDAVASLAYEALPDQQKAVEDLQEKYKQLNEAIELGIVTQQEAAKIAAGLATNWAEKTKEKTEETSEFAKQAARNMQDAFANFLFDPFSGGVKQMALDFANAVRRMAAEALASRIFEMVGMASGGGGGFASAIGSFFGFKDSGGSIPAGGFAVVGEKRPEIVTGPANVIGGAKTAQMMREVSGSADTRIRLISITDSQNYNDFLGSDPAEKTLVAWAERNAGFFRELVAS